MAFVAFKKCLKEPKQLLKLIVLIMCVCIASYQLSECFRKLIHPPTSTHYTFQLNDSINYPSVTICRNPGFKTDLFPKYGFTSDLIDYSSVWRNFNYTAYNISEFFEETTYTMDEVLSISGFFQDQNSVDVKEFYTLKYGRCFTLTATTPSSTFSEIGGYLLQFHHTDIVKTRNFYGISLAGYHLYIHQRNQILRVEDEETLRYMEYLYLEAGEDLRVNLRLQQYNKMNTADYECEVSEDYSRTKCEEECIYKQITNKFQCTAPWINIENINYPECNSYEMVRYIMLYYTDSYRQRYLEPCKCLSACNITVYSTYVQSRKEVSMPESNLSLYFSSNLITVMDEVLGYDWNTFISDMGGSLGFLLGLSVIGALSLAEQIFLLLFDNNLCRRKGKGSEEGKVLEEPPEIKIDDEKAVLKSMEKNNNGEYYNNIKKANVEKY